MEKIIDLGDGTSFVFDKGTKQLWLRSLFSLTCGMNGNDDIESRAGLAVICADNCRYEANRINSSSIRKAGDVFSFVQTSDDDKLRFEVKWRVFREQQIINCKYKLKNTSRRAISMRRILPRFVFSPGAYSVYSQLSRWGNENQGEFQPLRGADIVLQAKAARSTVGATPFCVLKDDETNRGVAFHVVPRGNWAIKVRSDVFSNEAPMAVVELGLSDEDLFFKLPPGESIELPDLLLQQLPDGDITKLAAPLHDFMNRELLKGCKLNTPPLVYNSWLYRFTNFTVEQLREQLKAAKKIGCECFVVDAGWFGPESGGWGPVVGDWREKTDRAFYGAMRDFADEVRREGLSFGLWMEPERYAAGIPVRKAHPQWFPEGTTRIDLTNPEAAEYFFRSIAEVIERYQVAYLKVDFNKSVGYDESGSELYNYCSGLNSQLSRLRRKFPQLVLENCAAGAMRTDLNTARFYDLSFLSDYVHPYESLRIRQGSMLRMAPGRIMSWAVLRQAPERLTPVDKTTKILACCAATWEQMGQFDLNFVMLSVLAGIPGFSGDLAGLDDSALEQLGKYCRFYKENREMLLNSHCHLLTELGRIEDNEKYIVFQAQSQDGSRSLVYVFSNGASRRALRYFALRGLDEHASYRIERKFPFNDEKTRIYQGRELMSSGLALNCEIHQHLKHIASLYIVEKC